VLKATPNPRAAITNQPVLLKATGATKLNLRYPGQYFEQEAGTMYNYFRDYDAAQGRYRQGDPIDLEGSLNRYGYAEGRPTSSIDPLGLKTFMCVKPLDALGGEGARSGPDVRGNPLHHQYLCISGGKGGYTCGGQDQRGERFDWAWGPGIPSKDKFNAALCEENEPDNECIEQCLLKKFTGPRPRYGIGPQGTDCQEWADDALTDCRKQCKNK